MDTKAADVQLRHFLATISALRAARKAIEGGDPTGVAGLDDAIKAHEASAAAYVEEIATTNWWRLDEIPALAGLIPLAVGLVGANDSVVRLAVRIGDLCRPRAPFEDAA